jgi:tRNA-dihydrouridine synthase B
METRESCPNRKADKGWAGMVNGSPLGSTIYEFTRRLLGTKLMLPPLAGYTDRPYRCVLAEFKPPFICTEMVSPHSVIHGNPKVRGSLGLVEGPHMSGVQLVGGDPKAMAEAAGIVESMGYDYIDINMGCTVKTVTRSGAGVSLMSSQEKAIGVAGAVVEAVDIPVTCKMRLGASSGSVNAVQLSRGLAEAGVSAITVHGRSGEKKFGLPVDYEGIRAVVNGVDVPVVANGGIFTGEDAVAMVERTGAAAAMPGRGLIGNPWLITEILSAFNGEPYAPPPLAERKDVCLNHLQHLRGFYGEQKGVIAMRRVLHKYFSGCRRVNLLKLEAQRVTSLVEVQAILDRVHEDGPHMFFSET